MIAFFLLASPVISLALLVAWIIAEWRNSPRKYRISLGVATLVTSLPLAMAFAVAITQLDDQSYFAASVQTILDESITALESGEIGFLERLKTFREEQVLTYESRSNLLENARAFKDKGDALRTSAEKAKSSPGQPR
ncbi:MAG: hypothetical protein AB7G28_20110 [Pirellulales bacterium]